MKTAAEIFDPANFTTSTFDIATATDYILVYGAAPHGTPEFENVQKCIKLIVTSHAILVMTAEDLAKSYVKSPEFDAVQKEAFDKYAQNVLTNIDKSHEYDRQQAIESMEKLAMHIAPVNGDVCH